MFAPTGPGVTVPFAVNDFWANEVTITHAYGGSPLDIVEATELIRARRLPVAGMITHRLPLAETGLGFRLVAEARESLKVIIEPQK
jgi:L-iditol 2-dehydrogenase